MWVLQWEGERVRHGSAFLPFIIPSPTTSTPTKRNLHLRRAHRHILCVNSPKPFIRVWLVLHSCLLLSYLPPRLPEKSSSLVFTASCEYHETTKQEAANLVIYDANSLSMAFSSFNITIALYIYSFAFLPLYHLIYDTVSG